MSFTTFRTRKTVFSETVLAYLGRKFKEITATDARVSVATLSSHFYLFKFKVSGVGEKSRCPRVINSTTKERRTRTKERKKKKETVVAFRMAERKKSIDQSSEREKERKKNCFRLLTGYK